MLIAFLITLFQLILSLYVSPFLLNKSRSLLSNTEALQVNTILKSNDFSDSFEGITFYIERKTDNNELLNIFIKDVAGNLNTIVNEVDKKKNSVIIAKKGFVSNDKLILFDGIIQTLDQKKELKNIQFEKTELSLGNVSTRTIKQPKIQETSSNLLFKCIFIQNSNLNLSNCSSKNYKSEVVQNLSRRLGTPLYIPLITVIISFLLMYRKEKKYNFLKKYILFILSFVILILAEILLKYTGFSPVIAVSYFILPIIIFIISYFYLIRKIITEKVS